MDKKEALDFLKEYLDELKYLRTLHYDNKEQWLWKNKVDVVLKEAFGEDSEEYEHLNPTGGRFTGIGATEEIMQRDYLRVLANYETGIQKILDKHKILGIGTPESQVTTPRFSNRTFSYIIDILADRSDSQLGHFFFKYGLLNIYQQHGKPTAKKTKVRDVFQHLITAGDESALDTLDLIVREVLKIDVHTWLEKWQSGQESFSQVFPDLERALSADGFQVHEGELIPAISPSIEPVKEEGLVEKLLDKYGFAIAKNHLEQAFDNYLDGNWEASNGALRSFLQDVFDQIALKLWPEEAAKKGAGGARRKLLQEKGFIDEDTEADLVRSFFKYAHGEGSHPGISDESDCRLRRYIAVALASYYLEKLGATS